MFWYALQVPTNLSELHDGVYRAKVSVSPKGPRERTLQGTVELDVCAGAETIHWHLILVLSLGIRVWLALYNSSTMMLDALIVARLRTVAIDCITERRKNGIYATI